VPQDPLQPMTHKPADVQWWSKSLQEKNPQKPCPPEKSDSKYVDDEFYNNAGKANDSMEKPAVGAPDYPFVIPGVTAQVPISRLIVRRQ
jgi:hypothetical protein